MASNLISTLLNPLNWIKAYRFSKSQKTFDKSSFDLELYLYSKILKNNMLHYGYFNDPERKPEEISIVEMENAQLRYAEVIMEYLTWHDKAVLDVGCGMGGLSKMLHEKKFNVTSITPNKNQIDFIHTNLKYLKTYHGKFETYETDAECGTIINSESLQYIDLDIAFTKVESMLVEKGRWIITDYFRLTDQGINTSSHLWQDFLKKVEQGPWHMVEKRDITPNILPTLNYIYMYATRFLFPIKHFAYEKLRYKKPMLYAMTSGMRQKIDAKIDKEIAAIDPNKFISEKKYMLIVLEKNSKN